MNKYKEIHLEKPNTLADFLPEKDRKEVVSLKITGLIGREDFEDVLDEMCESGGYYDADDNYIPDYESAAPLRHLDLSEATYVDDFIEFAKMNKKLIFLVTRIGCGIAGFTDEEIAPLFEKAHEVENIVLPEGW